jgi:hypothetical protein
MLKDFIDQDNALHHARSHFIMTHNLVYNATVLAIHVSALIQIIVFLVPLHNIFIILRVYLFVPLQLLLTHLLVLTVILLAKLVLLVK